MTITIDTRNQVRQRANFACEFCGVTETNTGGQLTIDHFQPSSQQGDDNLENLIYCCIRCNQYKADYWPTLPNEPSLWNPRCESRSKHFTELDGTLCPLTSTGAFTIKRLKLNRPPLVAHRLDKQQRAEEIRLLSYYQSIIELQNKTQIQLSLLLKEQQKILNENNEWLALFLNKKE